jgi:hypothetical protein
VVLAAEGAFAFFALSPVYARRSRLLAVACALAVQLGVLATMRVGMFTPLMLWTCVLCLPGARPPVPEGTLGVDKRRVWLSACCGALVGLMAWGVFVGRRWPMPRPIAAVQKQLGLVQPYDLFGATYEVQRWQALGLDAAGAPVELLASLAPGLRSEVGWRFGTLYKLTFSKDADHRAIAQWLCRRQLAETGTQLTSITLSMQARLPLHPGEQRPFREVVLYQGPCIEP